MLTFHFTSEVMSMQVYVLIGVLAYVMDRTLRVYRYRPSAFASPQRLSH